MKKLALCLLFVLPACAGGQGHALKMLDAGACVVQDDQLSVAFTDPAAAKKWLTELVERLEGPETTTVIVDGMEVPLPVVTPSDAQAVKDAVILAKKLLACIPD